VRGAPAPRAGGGRRVAGAGWAAELGEWFTIACATTTHARDSGADLLAATTLAGLTDRDDHILAKGRAANPVPSRPPGRRRRRRRSPAVRLLERLESHRDEVLRFLTDLRVPPTNNLAERDIRMVKLQQKISGCWRTLDGAQAFLTVRSYVATARKHGADVAVIPSWSVLGMPYWAPWAVVLVDGASSGVRAWLEEFGELAGEVIGRGPAEATGHDDTALTAAQPDHPDPPRRPAFGAGRAVVDLDGHGLVGATALAVGGRAAGGRAGDGRASPRPAGDRVGAAGRGAGGLVA
jgi:hypothetical protein